MKSKLKFNKADLNNVNKILTDLDIVVKNADKVDIARASANIVKEQKLKAPVDTGALKSGINYSKDGSGVAIVSEMEYSSYVEYGTSKQKPQPYFFNPARVVFRNFVKKLESKLNRKIR
jgi:HK97 gp10 family phage protein